MLHATHSHQTLVEKPYATHYTYDTLCIGKPSVENLWTLKALLRGFEMVLGLKVNFFKSCMIGVNVPSEFMDMVSSFLNCTQGSFPFKYLGLPVLSWCWAMHRVHMYPSLFYEWSWNPRECSTQ